MVDIVVGMVSYCGSTFLCSFQKLLKKVNKKGEGHLNDVCSTETTGSGDRPLHIAVGRKDKDAVVLLLQTLGEDARKHVCAPNSIGRTPSHIAAEEGLNE